MQKWKQKLEEFYQIIKVIYTHTHTYFFLKKYYFKILLFELYTQLFHTHIIFTPLFLMIIIHIIYLFHACSLEWKNKFILSISLVLAIFFMSSSNRIKLSVNYLRTSILIRSFWPQQRGYVIVFTMNSAHAIMPTPAVRSMLHIPRTRCNIRTALW